MRPLRVDLQAILLASLGLVSVLTVCCTVLDPRFLAVRTYLAPFRDRLLAQKSSTNGSAPVNHRPLDVRDWTCKDVAWWMNSQGWVWRELDQYTARICEIGVDGHALYNLEDDVLEQDIRMQYRLHRKLFLDAVTKLQAAQPQGVHLPRTVWEYRKEFPVRASVYFSGLLAAPRLTMFWLLLSEREMVQRVHDAAILRLQFIMGETRRSSTQGLSKGQADRGPERRTTLKPFAGFTVSSFMGQSWLFWFMSACFPGIQLFLYMALFFKRHPMAVLYCGVIGVLRTLSEGHAIYQLLTHPDMTAAEAFSSAICSHLMTPAINAALAILQVGLSSVLPSGLCRLLFWLRCVPLPLLTLWADFAAWVPTSEEELRNIEDGAPPAGGRRLPRNLGRTRREKEAHATHWPPALKIPQELEDDEAAAPEQFKCPITLAIMTEPALTPNGMTYERPAILKWLETRRHDPCTKAPLRKRHLAPNLALRGVIEAWVLEQCKKRGIEQQESSAGQRPALREAQMGSEAGANAEGGDVPLHGAALSSEQSSQGLRHRIPYAQQEPQLSGAMNGQNDMNGNAAAQANVGVPAQNGVTDLRVRLAGVNAGIRPLTPQSHPIMQ